MGDEERLSQVRPRPHSLDEVREVVDAGLRRYIELHKSWPTPTNLLDIINSQLLLPNDRLPGLGFLFRGFEHKQSGLRGTKGLVRIAEDRGIYRAAIMDAKVYTNYPGEFVEVEGGSLQDTQLRVLDKLSTNELVNLMGRITAELVNRKV